MGAAEAQRINLSEWRYWKPLATPRTFLIDHAGCGMKMVISLPPRSNDNEGRVTQLDCCALALLVSSAVSPFSTGPCRQSKSWSAGSAVPHAQRFCATDMLLKSTVRSLLSNKFEQGSRIGPLPWKKKKTSKALK